MLNTSNGEPKENLTMTKSVRTAEYGYFYFSFTDYGKAFRGLAENERV